MKFPILYNLWKAHRELSPSRQFKRALWQKLEHRPELQSGLIWYHYLSIRVTGVTAGVLGVVFVGTGVYAYNSPTVTEGTPLYPVKIQIENIEEQTQRTPQAKARFLLKKVTRREDETKVIIQRQLKKLPSTIINFSTSTTSTLIPIDIQKTEREIEAAEKKLNEIKAQLSGTDADKLLRAAIDDKIKQRHDRGQGQSQGRSDDENGRGSRSNSSTPDNNSSSTVENGASSTPPTTTTDSVSSTTSIVPTSTTSTSATSTVPSTTDDRGNNRRGRKNGNGGIIVTPTSTAPTNTIKKLNTTSTVKNTSSVKNQNRNGRGRQLRNPFLNLPGISTTPSTTMRQYK